MSEFKIGDRVKVSDNPGTRPEPGSGFVGEWAHGKTGTIDGRSRSCFHVAIDGEGGFGQFVDPAHLTLID